MSDPHEERHDDRVAVAASRLEYAEMLRASEVVKRAALTTWLATAVNVLAILVVAFSIGPKIDRLDADVRHLERDLEDGLKNAAQNRQLIADNHAVLEASRKDLAEILKTQARLNAILDQAERAAKEREARAKAAEEARERAAKDKEKKP